MTAADFSNHPEHASGRGSDPVAKQLASAQSGTGTRPKSADDKLDVGTGRKSRGTYVTPARLMTLSSSLTGQDWTVLTTLSKLRLASSGQLERLCFIGVSQRRARQALASLTDRGVIARLPRIVGGARSGSAGYVYTLDVAGARLLRPGRRFRRPDDPGERFLAHGLAVAELYTRLVEADRADTLELRQFTSEPGCWRTFAGPYGRAVLKPDALLVTRLGHYEDRWFVEVDRATEGVSALARKCETFRRYWQSGTEQAQTGVFPRVLFLVPDAKRYDALIDVFSRQPEAAWPLFTTALFDEAVTRIARGADV